MFRKPIAALILASSFAAGAGLAQAQSSHRAAGDASRSAAGVEYTTGGVGLVARQQLESRADQYNLHLEFAYAPEGEYLAAVDVEIADSSGNTVLSTTTDGPWLLAKLPSGRYTVKASYGGVTRTQQISVSSGQRHLVMRFPAQVETDDVANRSSSARNSSMAYSR